MFLKDCHDKIEMEKYVLPLFKSDELKNWDSGEC